MKNILFLLLLSIGVLEGQGISEYTSLSYLSSQEQSFPDIVKSMEAMEEELSRVVLDSSSVTYTLPVVFHIIYADKSNKPTAEEVSSVLTVLNTAFYGNELPSAHPSIRSGYSKRFADIGLRFAASNKVEAYNYYQDSTTNWTWSRQIQGKYPALSPEKNINIWIVDLPQKERGYAQFPEGNPGYDGIVLNYKEWDHGLARLEGTLAHLMGNYLGLYPIWGRCACCDDYVGDTPMANAPNYSCEKEVRHISTCYESFTEEMTYNSMDGGINGCGVFFTKGQRERILKVLHYYRRGLLP